MPIDYASELFSTDLKSKEPESNKDYASEMYGEGLRPAKIQQQDGEVRGLLQTREEPTGDISTITTKPIMRPAEGVPEEQEAGFLTSIETGIVDDPQTKINILSKRMDIPVERFGITEGEIVYQGEDGYFHYAMPHKGFGKLKTMGASMIAHSPEIALATALSPGGPGMAAVGGAGGAGIRKGLGALLYDEPQTTAKNVGEMAMAGAFSWAGAKTGKGAIKGIDLSRGKQGARLMKAAGRSRERISLPEVKAMSKLGKKHGIDLLPPQTTRSPELISRFNILGDLPETADAIGTVRRGQYEQIQSAITKYINSVSPEAVTKIGTGEKAVKAAQKAIFSAKTIRANKAKPLYTEAFAKAPKINIKPVIGFIDDELKTAKGKIRSELIRAKNILEKPDLPKEVLFDAKGMPLKTAKISYDTSLKGLHASKMEFDDIMASSKQTGLGNTVKRNYGQIRKLLLNQIDEASPDYAKARKIFAGDSEVFNQIASKKGIIGRLAKLEGEEAEKASKLIFRSSPQVIKKARNAIIKHSDEKVWDNLVKVHLQDSFEGIKETVTGGITNVGGRFRQKVFGDVAHRKMLRAAMTDQQYKYLDDFAKVLDRTGLLLGKESTTAIRQLQLKEMGEVAGTSAQIAKAIAYPLHTWKMALKDRVERAFGGKYAENLAEAMTSRKGAEQLQKMLQLKPGSQNLIIEFSTFLTTVSGVPVREEKKKRNYPDIKPKKYSKDQALEMLGQ